MVDLCSAPGGKTGFIGELLNNSGVVFAVDRNKNRLKRVIETCKRLGIKNAEFIAEDGENYSADNMDAVLIDAPCSGLGVLAKKPDLKWRRSLDDIYVLRKQQIALLNNGAKMLKKGGILLYSTCTIEPEENHSVIKHFLKNHRNFKMENAASFVPDHVVDDLGFIYNLPDVHNMDGSFAARLIKVD